MRSVYLKFSSTNAGLFSDPVPVVPASYIIDLKGKPLDVITITPEMDENIFLQRIKMALKVSL